MITPLTEYHFITIRKTHTIVKLLKGNYCSYNHKESHSTLLTKTMANLIHLQNALNKVVDDVRQVTLEGFATYLRDNKTELGVLETVDVKNVVSEYLKSNTSSTFSFGPKKKEKKTRPPNSYNMFIKEKMREIKEANPQFKGKELMKRATEEWNKQKLANAIVEAPEVSV